MRPFLLSLSCLPFVLLLVPACASEDGAGPADTLTPPDDGAPSETLTPREDATLDEGEVRLAKAGWSLGECGTACIGDLTVAGTTLSLAIRDRELDPISHRASGTFTAAAAAQVVDLLAALDPTGLEPSYGCPDCNDGGASSLVFETPEGLVSVLYEQRSPPAILAELDALVLDAMQSLHDCVSGDTVVVDVPCGAP